MSASLASIRLAASRLAWSLTSRAARCTATPPSWSDRDAYVPVPRGMRSVSPWITVTLSMGMPRSSCTAGLAVHDDGAVTVYTGSSPHGQGHDTAWAMALPVRGASGVDRDGAV